MKRLLLAVLSIVILILAGCRPDAASTASTSEYFEDARFINADSLADGAMRVQLINPWDSLHLLADYLMINKSCDSVIENRENATVVHLPLQRLIVYSAVHAALLCELGYADAIVGVADAQYIKTPEIKERLADGRIVDIGSSTEPSLEKIIALQPDALLISPFRNSGHGIIDKTGIPVIDCADYMETTPLGRAEWSKFYAMLVQGVSPENSALYQKVKENYCSLRDRRAATGEKPRVITELQHRGVWMVPGGRSFVAQMIADAGGEYPFADNPSPGSLQYPYEKVYSASKNCDIWLLKSLTDITLGDVAKNTKFNKNIWAFRNGGVYNANTATGTFYEETPFHPDLLLRDYVTIFHHTSDSLRYFVQVTD